MLLEPDERAVPAKKHVIARLAEHEREDGALP